MFEYDLKQMCIGILCQGSKARGVGRLTLLAIGLVITAFAGGPQTGFLWRDGQMLALPPLAGLTQSQASAINSHGVVVGTSFIQSVDTSRATLWYANEIVNLGVPSGFSSCSARALNNLGQIAGTCRRSGGTGGHAILWESPAHPIDLGIPTGFVASEALGINDAGEVVGRLTTTMPGVFHAFIWVRGTMRDIGSFWAYDINNRGQVVGYSFSAWYNGSLTNPGLSPYAINSSGTMAGFIFVGGGPHAATGDGSAVVDLGTLPGYFSDAWAINSSGDVAGRAFDITDAAKALLWKRGVLLELGALPGDDTSVAQGINNRGEVVGVSWNSVSEQ